MASEYFKQKALKELQNETPEEPVVLTRKEKIKNWFYYHKVWLIIGAVLVVILGTMLWNILGIGKTKPDYIFALVAKEPYSDEQADALADTLALLGEDVNGDGKVKVEIRQYATRRTGDVETAIFFNQAADTKLLADMTSGDSYFFLTDDPYELQRAYQILANADGSEPEEYDRATEDKVFALKNCPALAGIDPAFSELYLGRRWFMGGAFDAHQADATFWDVLTKGATH